MEHLAILSMVLNGMARKNLLPQFEILEERCPRLFVHESAMNLMFNERHQHNHRREPASQRQHLKQHYDSSMGW